MSWRRLVLVSVVFALAGACTVTPSPVPLTKSPSLAPESARPATPSPTPEAIASESPPDESTASPGFPPFPGSASLEVGGRQMAPSHLGGCWVLFHDGEQVLFESCGPDPFDLDAESTLISPAVSLVFSAPAEWSFSSEGFRIGSASAWQVTIAPVSSLEHLPTDRQESIYLAATGQVLGTSDKTAATIAVVAPSLPGEYLLELRANIARDGWTWGPVLHHWRISIM